MSSRKQTIEDFIKKARKVHGDKYDYSVSIYTGCKESVDIRCIVHDYIFTQSASDHTSGCGCPKCADEVRAQKRRVTKQEFIDRATTIHCGKYAYSKVDFISLDVEVTMICPIHGEFSQKPSLHLSGRSCKKCKADGISKRKRDSREDFISKAIAVHGNKYDYSLVDYTRSGNVVNIICKEHGAFPQYANNHISGYGCPNCCSNGYKRSSKGYLYLLSCGDMVKIGITNSSPKSRAKRVSSSFGAEFKVIDSWHFKDGSIPDSIETTLLRELRSEYDRPTNKFEGSSECFLSVDYGRLLCRINEEIALRQ